LAAATVIRSFAWDDFADAAVNLTGVV